MRPSRNFRSAPAVKAMKCSCGGVAKMRSRRNYPFGVKSKSLSMSFYKCPSCGKESLSKKVQE